MIWTDDDGMDDGLQYMILWMKEGVDDVGAVDAGG